VLCGYMMLYIFTKTAHLHLRRDAERKKQKPPLDAHCQREAGVSLV